jgi:hypothetical protein
VLQIVFAGVFLLTKASAPAHAQSQPASPLAAADEACSHLPMCTAACLLQIVFAGVFLLTKASAPAHSQSQPASPLAAADELAHHAKVAYLQSSLDGTDEAPGVGSERGISTAADTQPDGSSAPVPGTLLSSVAGLCGLQCLSWQPTVLLKMLAGTCHG